MLNIHQKAKNFEIGPKLDFAFVFVIGPFFVEAEMKHLPRATADVEDHLCEAADLKRENDVGPPES